MVKERIIEAYCWKPVKTRRNPLGEKGSMKLAGGCLIAIVEAKKPTEIYGAGTVKIIPVSRRIIKNLAKDLRLRGGKK